MSILIRIFLLFFSIHYCIGNQVFTNVNLHNGLGEFIPNATIVVSKNKFVFVGKKENYSIQKNDTVHDLQGKHIYPGLISLNSRIGLIELDAVRASNDTRETSKNNAGLQSYVAYNVDSDVVPTLLSNGITLAQVTPDGELIKGQSSAIYMTGDNYQKALFAKNVGLHINWPSYYSFYSYDSEHYENRKKTIKYIEDFLTDAVLYKNKNNKVPTNANLEAAQGLFDGSKTLFVHVFFNKDVIEAVLMAKKFGVKKICIVNPQEPHLITTFLKENNVKVILSRIHSLPHKDETDIDMMYKLPYLLDKDSVEIAISYYGDMESQHSKNLPFTAGTAVAYGLEKEKALKLITYNAAKILGIETQVGSIEVGKLADFLVCKGDIFNMSESIVEQVYINGVSQNLTDKHKTLNSKYLEKYGLNR